MESKEIITKRGDSEKRCLFCANFERFHEEVELDYGHCKEKGMTKGIDGNNCKFYSDLVLNPYHNRVPYNCPYFYEGWDCSQRCKINDYCMYDEFRECSEYNAIFGPRWVAKYRCLRIMNELNEEGDEKDGD